MASSEEECVIYMLNQFIVQHSLSFYMVDRDYGLILPRFVTHIIDPDEHAEFFFMDSQIYNRCSF